MLDPIPSELDIWEMPDCRLVPLWLAAGYCYEVEHFELIPDSVWHALCARIDAEYESLSHGHLHLIDRGALAAGTCFYLAAEDFPPMARGLAKCLAWDWHGRPIEYRVLPPGKWTAGAPDFW